MLTDHVSLTLSLVARSQKRLADFEAYLRTPSYNVAPQLTTDWTLERAEWDSERSLNSKIIRYYYVAPPAVSAETKKFLKKTEVRSDK